MMSHRLIVVLLLLLGCAQLTAQGPATTQDTAATARERAAGDPPDEAIAAMVKDATGIRVLRVGEEPLPADEQQGQSIDGYPVLRVGPSLEGEPLELMKQTLIAPASHEWNGGFCGFWPNVALRLEGKQRVDILICFTCSEWRWLTPDGQVLVRSNLTPAAWDVIVKQARATYPDDEFLAAVQAKK